MDGPQANTQQKGRPGIGMPFFGKENSMIVNILAIGDVCGQNGLDYLCRSLRRLKSEKKIAFTVVNGENAAVKGILPRQAEDILDAGADAITLGNHTFGKNGIQDYLDDCPSILRPANLAPQNPGRGWQMFDTAFGEVCVVNLIGRFQMNNHADNPFATMDKLLKKLQGMPILVDFHAEATSEKLAMGFDLDGKVSACWGTHTHVPTADLRILPKGTGYITDLGMTGPMDSALGVDPAQSIALFRGELASRFAPAPGPCWLCGAIFDIDLDTNRCIGVEQVQIID